MVDPVDNGASRDEKRAVARGSLTGALPITWARHEFGPSYCAVSAVDVSVHTACKGRWPAVDNCTIHDAPPAAERCRGCVRALLVQALQELSAASVELSARAAEVSRAIERVNQELIAFYIAEHV